MDKKPLTKSEGLRLTVGHWLKLRQLMQARGRQWLEKVIDREHKKIDCNKDAA